MSITIDWQSVRSNGQPIKVEPIMAAIVDAILERQSDVIRAGYGTILVSFAPKAAKVTVWKKVSEDGT